jgi:hypothetical protein
MKIRTVVPEQSTPLGTSASINGSASSIEACEVDGVWGYLCHPKEKSKATVGNSRRAYFIPATAVRYIDYLFEEEPEEEPEEPKTTRFVCDEDGVTVDLNSAVDLAPPPKPDPPAPKRAKKRRQRSR